MTRLRLLNLHRLAQQPLRTIVAVVAVAGGVALTLGVAVAYTSVQQSFADVDRFVTGPATIRVRGASGHGGLDAGVLPQVEAVDGVAAAVPLVTTVVVVTDGTGDDRLVLALGSDLLARAAVGDVPLLPDGLAARLGPGVVVRTNAGVIPLDGAATSSELDGINDGNVLVWPLATAQRLLTREGRLDVVLVVPEAGADHDELRDRIALSAGDHNVVEDAAAPSGATFVTQQLLPGLALSSLAGLFVGMQLVSTAFAVSFEERRRELAVAAAVGATPRLVAFALLAEAAVLGVAGGLLGTLGAALVGRAFVATLAGEVAKLSGIDVRLHVPPVLVAVGVVIGVGAAVVAAIRPARAAARLDLAAELADRDRHAPEGPTRRWLLATLSSLSVAGLVLGWLGWRGGTLEPWQAIAVLAGIVLTGTAVTRIPGLVAADAVAFVGRWSFARRGSIHVAVGNLLADRRRTASVTNALAAAAFISVTIGAVLPAITDAAERDAVESVGNGVVVSSLGVNNTAGTDSKLPPDAMQRLAAVPGLDRLLPFRWSSLDHPDIGRVSLSSSDGEKPTYAVLRGTTRAESFAAGRVMVGPALARRLHLEPGDRFAVPGVHGPVELTVGGIWSSPENIGSSVHAPADLFERIAGDRPPTHLVAIPVEGVSFADLADRIRAAGIHDRLVVLDPEELADTLGREYRGFAAPFVAMQRALLGVAFLATLSTLLLAAVQRRRELATLAAVGMPPADLARMTLAEAVIVAAVATAVGTVGGLATYVAMVFASPTMTGLSFEWVLPWQGVPSVALAIVAVALAGAAWPAWRSTRVEPALALRYE